MRVSLVSPLRIETAAVDGRMITRIFTGDVELAATPGWRSTSTCGPVG